MVDNHAHAMLRQQPDDVVAFRANFTEAHDPKLARDHVRSSVQYCWALRQLTRVLGISPDEEEFMAHRREREFSAYARWLVQNAHLDWLLLDEGYPPPELAYSSPEMERTLGVRVGRILRIETFLEQLLGRHHTVADIVSEFDQALGGAVQAGYVALKSIAAYRTGLMIEPVPESEVNQAFREIQRDVGGPFRLTSKPIIDFFVHRALGHAAEHGIPMQFHTGYGDPDLDLRLSNPLHLRTLFDDLAFTNAPIVLLHESFPFTAEAAYLASVYPNAYVDVAFSLPPLARDRLTEAVRVVLGAAPASKVLCSSDGTRIPEHYWLGAVRARLCLSDVLGEMIDGGELDASEALALAEAVLHENAVRIYGLRPSVAS